MRNKTEIIALFDKSSSTLEMFHEEKNEILNLMKKENLTNSDFGDLRAHLFEKTTEVIKPDNAAKAMKWLEESVKILDKGKISIVAQTSEVYFSPGEDCRNRIRRAILEARNSLDICVFTISDRFISDPIILKQNEGIQIRVITDNDKCNDIGSEIHDLSVKKIPIKTDNSPAHMHHKFVVIDRSITITGSYNWTHSAAKENQENIIVLHDEKVASNYLKEFEKLWGSTISY